MYVVLCNCPPAAASNLARTLVMEGLAACVNIVPNVRSVYVWNGELEDEEESTLLIKTGAASVAALGDRIRALHPYDTVEVLALPVDVERSDPSYVAWVKAARPWTGS